MLIKFIVHCQRINVGGLPVRSESPRFGVQHLWWGFYQPPRGSSLAARDPPRWLPYVGQLCCCNGCLADKTGESAHSLFYFHHGKCWLDLNGRILILQVAIHTENTKKIIRGVAEWTACIFASSLSLRDERFYNWASSSYRINCSFRSGFYKL